MRVASSTYPWKRLLIAVPAMKSERWKQVDSLLQSALERPPAERADFLRQACAGDETLEREVLSLLASQQAAGVSWRARL